MGVRTGVEGATILILLTVFHPVSVSFGFVSGAQVRTWLFSLNLFIISQLLFWVLLKGRVCPPQGTGSRVPGCVSSSAGVELSSSDPQVALRQGG